MAENVYKAGEPMAKLVPLGHPRPTRREPGGWEGQVRIADDFDAPLPPELVVAFEGKNEDK